ncbi:MAG: ATP-binding protein [Sulfuritalea sp.]|jgi:two-component system NtrC family sensor kinase|nr:ATP-binding protein [Sulfuritalea sp.]
MRPLSLRVRVSLYLFIALSVAMILFTVLILKHRQEDMQDVVSQHVTQLSDVVVASTRYTMLVNKRDIAEKIIEDIGKQKGIERVRVISADGTIIHSNHSQEIGYSVQQDEEPCVNCHQTSKPLQQVPDEKRWKIHESPDGHRVLGTMRAIRNERSCSSASCHEHPASQSVLGIVDLAYSLDEMDQSMRTHALHVISISVGFILLFSISIGLLLQRLIYLPLKDLKSGAEKVASGNLDPDIPVRNDDEFGHLAGSFNDMTKALNESRQELQELVQTLELKVEERTQELLVAEAEIAQGEKLASVGVLAAGIAHELNNPLTGVLTFTSLLRKKMPDGSEDAEDLDLVIRETRRCASIIKRLLDFAREKVPTKGWFDLKQVIDDTVRFTDRPASLRHIEIKTNLDPELPLVWGDADLIKQVILNILVNAQQAIEAEGNITVESHPYVAKAPAKPGVEALPMIEIVIKDTGCGIPEANLQRIFDPFFTSKEVGKGTGLGLSVSYGIVKAHGGRIEVESVVGKGSTFRVLLPVTSPFGDTEQNAGESSQ